MPATWAMLKRNILLLDDDPEIADLVRFSLQSHHCFQLTWLDNPEEMLRRIKSDGFDIVLLDLCLPGMNGREVLRTIRADPATSTIPVIMLTASADEKLIPKCLNEGADDFIHKPWNSDEFIARIRAVIRRRRNKSHRSIPLCCGPLTLDVSKRSVILNGCPLELTRTEFDLLLLLLENKGQVMDRRCLLEEIWGTSIAKNENIHTRTLDTHAQNIRRKIQPYSDMLETIPRIGYRLNSAPNGKAAAK